MSLRSMMFSAAVIVLTGCVASPTGQIRGPGAGCPMNFKQYCEVSPHRTGEPDPPHCRCIRHSDIKGMLDRDY